MEDSLSEASERSKSNNTNNSDQTKDAQMIAESKGAQLAAENAQLTKENSVLKAQVDQANTLGPEIDKVHGKNKELTSENRRIKEEKEDLEKRFEILQKTNADLEKQLEEEKQRCRVTQKQCIENSKKEIKKAKTQANSKVDEILKQLETFQEKSEKDDIAIKTFKSKIERLLENATRYFNQEFHDIDSFIEFLSGSFPTTQTTPAGNSGLFATPVHTRTAPSTPAVLPPSAISGQSSNFNVQQVPGSVAQLEKKLKREKTRTKTLTNDKDELEMKIERLKREINEINIKHQAEIERLNKEAEKASEEQALTDANTQHTIQNLENKIENLTRKNDELKQKIREAEIAFGIPQPQFPEQTQNQIQQTRQINPESSQSLFQYQVQQQSPSPYIANQNSQPVYSSPMRQPLFSPASQNGRPPLSRHASTPTARISKQSSIVTPQRSTFREGEDQIHNCASSEHLVNQNIDLNERLKGSNNRCEELTDRLKRSETQRNELQILLEKEKGENNSLKIVHSNTVKELDMMREALHFKESVKDRNDKKLMRREYNELKAKLEGVTQQLASMKKQLNESIIEHQRDLTNIKNLNREIEDLQEDKSNLTKELEATKEELINVQAEFESYRRNEITPEKVIPLESWQSEKFPNEINTSISKISSNSSLEPKTKLKNIYTIISKKYGDMIKNRDRLLEESYTETQNIKDTVKEFVSDLAIALEVKSFNFDEFMNKISQQEIIDRLKKMRTCHDELKRSNQQLTQTLTRVHQTFGSVGFDMNDNGGFNSLEEITNKMEREVTTVKTELTNTRKQLEKRSKKCKELGTALKTLKRKSDNESEDSKQQISRLLQENEKLRTENDELSKKNQQFKWDVQKLSTEFKDFKEQQEEENKEKEDQFETQTKFSLLEKQRLEENYQEQIRNLTEEFNDTAAFVREHEDEIAQLKQEKEEEKAKVAEREREINRLRRENEELKQSKIDRNYEDENNLISNYEKAVEEQKIQCEGHRSDVEKLTNQLASTEKQLKHYKEKIIEMKKERAIAEVELRKEVEQAERQKKLIETSTKIELMNTKSTLNAKLEEENKKYETEKRKIFSTIADTFRQFFTIDSSLNEKTFKSTLFKARDELARLTSLDKSIRRLVNAEVNQKTDDAVAQIVISQSK